MSVINTNISSMQAQSSLRSTNLNLSTAMERLSSGTRINSAKDDAAGLAISTRMTSEIRGIGAAIRNANDGISLMQTAEGALGQIGDNLQRIRELAVQSSNTGNSASDRAAMNNEAKQLIAEIDRVASGSSFNGIKLLDGSFQNQDLQVGAGNTANDRISLSVTSAKANALGVGSNSSYSSKVEGGAVGALALAAGALAINGYEVGAAVADGVSASNSNTSGIAVAAAINAISGKSGVTATVGETTTVAADYQVDAVTTVTTAVAETQTITVTGSITATAGSAVTFMGIDTASIAKTGGTATVIAAAIVSAKTAILAGSTAQGLGVTDISQTGGVLTITFTGGTSVVAGSGDVADLASVSTSAGASFSAGTEVITGVQGIALSDEVTGLTGYATPINDDDIRVNGVSIGALAAAGDSSERGGQMAAAINSKSSQTGVTATFDTTSGAVQLNAVDGRNIDISVKGSTTLTSQDTGLTMTETDGSGTAADADRVVTTVRSEVTLQSTGSAGISVASKTAGAATASGLTMVFEAAEATAGAGVASIDLSTAAGAQAALTTVDAAINTITDSRSSMGAYQNRLSSSISNLESSSMNLSASRSRILDTDYAKETTNLAKAQIISQAATAMLAQANQSGQSVLALLK